MTGPPALLVSKHSATLSCNVSLPINRNNSEIVKLQYQHNDYFVVLNRLRKLKESCRRKQPLHHPQLAENEKTALRSLGFPEQHWRRDEISSAESTCEWLLQNQTFNTWLDPQDKMERLLWIVGNPGTGKSTMMKYVFNVIEQQWHIDYVLISYFFHGRGVALQKTKLGFLRSILHQVLRRLVDSLAIFLQFYGEKSTAVKEAEIQWTEAELERILTHIIRELDENVRILLLVDALDESGEETAQNIVNLLRRMTTSTKVKSIFSCRRYPILQTGCRLISMEKGNEADIQTVVRSLLGEEFENCGDASSLEESILRRANGMFQWAILVTRSIIDKHRQLGSSIFALQKIIEELPSDLHKLYASLLQAIEEDEKRQTVKLLHWILFSIRPLTAEELQYALVADEDMPGSIHDFHNSPNFVDPEKGTTTFSKGLAEIRGHYGVKIAQFIHQSVSDYLITEGGLGELIKSTSRISVVGESHFLISRSCVRYALLPEMSVPPLKPDREQRELLSAFEKRFPLAEYIRNYWILRTMHVESTDIDQKNFLEYLQNNENKMPGLHLLMHPV